MAAFTSTMPVGTMATFLLVIVAAMAVQTTATRPAADGYAAAPTTTKPTEDTYTGAAATTTTDKPTMSLGEKSAMETGSYHVSEKEIEDESSKIKDKLQQLANSGEKDSDAYFLLVKANTHLRLAREKLKDSTTATSPEKIAACKKDADANFFVAMFCIAGSRGPGAYAATGGTVNVKPATKQATEAVAQPVSDAYAAKVDAAPKEEASTKEETEKRPAADAYATKDATSKEVGKQPAADVYAAKVDAAPKEEASTKEETGKQPAADAYATRT